MHKIGSGWFEVVVFVCTLDQDMFRSGIVLFTSLAGGFLKNTKSLPMCFDLRGAGSHSEDCDLGVPLEWRRLSLAFETWNLPVSLQEWLSL